jgi:ABC-type lipoprotein release transport system permease subunit
MARIWSQAARNLGRNRRRTTVTALALAFGMMLCIATYAVVDGMTAQMLHSLTKYDLGHVQIHRPAYVADADLEGTLDGVEELLSVAKKQPGVVGAAPRLYGFGLVSAGGKSSGVQLVGVSPKLEAAISELDATFVEGAFLSGEATPWGERHELSLVEKAEDAELTRAAVQDALAELESLGEIAAKAEPPSAAAVRETFIDDAARERARQLALSESPRPEAPLPVVFGDELAKALHVKLGDQLFLSTATTSGQNEAVFVKVHGIFSTGTQVLDRNRMYLHILDMGRLLAQEGKAHEVSVVVGDVSQATPLAHSLRKKLGKGDALVRPWDEIRPEIAEMLKMNDVSSIIMVSIILFVAALGVVNTMLMAVFERTRELGVLKAIGMSPFAIVRMMMAETLLLALLGGVSGLLLGLGLDVYLMVEGLDLSGSTGGMNVGNVGINPVIYGVITPSGVLFPMAILLGITMLAALYPAVRAARLQPAIGMRET